MAEGGVLRRLETEVTCPLCLEIFTKPKKLPCEHVYCTQCLRGLALRSTTASITCPECRAETPVPPNFDVSQFVTPHQVNRLVEMYQQSLKLAHTQEATQEKAEPQPASCKVHKSQPLALYCETCESLVCRDCILLSCAKKNHQHGFIQDVVKKYQADLSQRLQPVKKLQQQALEAISEREREIQARKEEKLHQIETTFDVLAEILSQERQYFTEEVKRLFEEQENINSSKKSEISMVLAQLQSLTHSTETTRANPSAKDLDEIKQSLEQVELARNVSLQPALLPEMGVGLWDPVKFKQECHINNFTYEAEDPLKSHFQRSVDLHDLHIPISEVSTHVLHIDQSNITKKITISAQLQFCYDESSEPAVVKKVTPTQYSLSFTPRKRGRHKLHIMYNNTHILGSPINIFVTAEPHQFKPIARKKIGNAAGIKCHQGLIYVSDGAETRSPGSGLKIFESLSKAAKKCIKQPGLIEVLITGENIYGTDVNQHRIVKMDMDGTVIESIGRQGTGPGEFKYPNGIRQSKDKNIYVCDSDNSRIQVLDENLKPIKIISNNFNWPSDLDFDDVGNLYVVDAHDCIQVLTPEGQFIRNIGRPAYDTGPGELKYPLSPAIHKDLLYVTETYNNRISVFKTSGEFIATFGEGITKPECIAVDDNGYIYVTSDRKFITVF